MSLNQVDYREPQPGEIIRLLDIAGDPGTLYTKVRQLLSSTADMILHEVKDDQGIMRVITCDNRVRRTWLEIDP